MASADLEGIPWGTQTKDGQVLRSMPWEIFVLGVASLSIVNLFLAILVRNPDLDQVIAFTDSVYIVIFAADFVRRIYVAQDDRAYFTRGYGWLDLFSIIPLLRIARLLRIVRVIRLVGRMGGPMAALTMFFKNRATAGLLLVFLIALVVLEYGSLAVLWAEPGSNVVLATTGGSPGWLLGPFRALGAI